SSGGPFPIRGSENSWPTIVLESGYSQTLQSLRSKMRWWFSASDHEVKIVLLVKFFHNRTPPHILLEKWTEVSPAGQAVTRPVTRAVTRAAAQGVPIEPTLGREITIRRTPASPSAG